jgi:ankyrin repeat protein
MKLQDRGKQIDGLSARIKTHTDALQMSLQIVTIKISLATPDFLLRQLDEALQDISTRLAKMEDRKCRLLDHNGLQGDNEDPLIELAQDALRRGTLLYQASVAGSSIGDESTMSSEKVEFVEDWIHGLGHPLKAHAPQDGPSCIVPVSGNVNAPTTRSPVEAAIREASSLDETARDAGSSSWDDDGSQCESLPSPEVRPAPAELHSDSHKSPILFERPLDQWKRSEIVTLFNIKPDGWFEEMICTGLKVDPKDLLALKESGASENSVSEAQPKRNKLALHLAVLFQDLQLVKSLVNAGYSPDLSAQVTDRKPLHGLRTPIGIAIASHCRSITEVLLNHRAQLTPTGASSPCLQLFAKTSLDSWPATDVDSYKGVLELSLNSESVWRDPKFRHPDHMAPWAKHILHQICDLPKAWFHLRLPLIDCALACFCRHWGKGWRNSSFLHVAIKLRDLKTIKHILNILDVQLRKSHLQRKNKTGQTPLVYAIKQVETHGRHSVDIVRALLKAGAGLDDTAMGPVRRFGGFIWKEIPIRDIAMQSSRADLKELVAKY